MKMNIARENSGVSLIELVIVVAVIGLLSIVAVPQYGRFIAKGKVRSATNDLFQNMRMARTMAIKENRQYLITFNEAADPANTYRIGFDGNGNNSLTDPVDGYGGGTVRLVNLQTQYGNEITFGTGTGSGPDEPDTCPACIGIGGSTVAFGGTAAPVRQAFNTDGSVSFTGSAFLMHNARGITYMMRISFQTGKIDLWKWDGDNTNPAPPIVNNCNNAPVRYCGWTELR
jgi:prepilin-type N-terminal cleavage/methylation domain-containing protein